MNEFNEGMVVIVGTGQAGTIIGISSDQVSVLLANTDLWYGHKGLIREPQSAEDLSAAPFNVDRFKDR